MEELLAQKYSNLVDAEDVEELFEKMRMVYGSKQKTADRCGIARSTPYRWPNANYVKSATKIKVLEASLKEKLLDTLELLTKRSKEKTSDLFLTYLSSVFQKAGSVDTGSFSLLLNKFLVARRENYGLIRDELQDEVRLMTQALEEKAIELHVPFSKNSIDTFESSQFLEILPDIIKDLIIEKTDVIEVANRYNVPLEIPITIKDTCTPFLQRPKPNVVTVQPKGWYHPAVIKTPKVENIRGFQESKDAGIPEYNRVS
jgi:hypothetical protein